MKIRDRIMNFKKLMTKENMLIVVAVVIAVSWVSEWI